MKSQVPKLAATIIVAVPVRTATSGSNYRILMVKRSGKSRFMPGVHVFPGGIVENADYPEHWNKLFSVSELAGVNKQELALRMAAIREVFEETNVLICTPSLQKLGIQTQDLLSFSKWRTATQKNPGEFLNLFTNHIPSVQSQSQISLNCKPDVTRLYKWAHWITPQIEKWRYDTHFYLAVLEDELSLTVLHDDLETTSIDWFSPEEALRSFEKGDIKLAPPTWLTIKELCQYTSYGDLIKMGTKRSVPMIEPKLFFSSDGSAELLLPGDFQYDDYKEGEHVPHDKVGKSNNVNRILIDNNKTFKLITSNRSAL